MGGETRWRATAIRDGVEQGKKKKNLDLKRN